MKNFKKCNMTYTIKNKRVRRSFISQLWKDWWQSLIALVDSHFNTMLSKETVYSVKGLQLGQEIQVTVAFCYL